jgi:hypothetical protein
VNKGLLGAVVGAISAIAVLLLSWSASNRNRRNAAPTEGAPELYRNNFGSGRSLATTLTRIGGARNCLQIVITPDEIVTRTYFPFSIFAGPYDLEHRIDKRDIIGFRESKSFLAGRILTLQYRREDGQSAELELIPKRYEAFRQALLTGLDEATLRISS